MGLCVVRIFHFVQVLVVLVNNSYFCYCIIRILAVAPYESSFCVDIMCLYGFQCIQHRVKSAGYIFSELTLDHHT